MLVLFGDTEINFVCSCLKLRTLETCFLILFVQVALKASTAASGKIALSSPTYLNYFRKASCSSVSSSHPLQKTIFACKYMYLINTYYMYVFKMCYHIFKFFLLYRLKIIIQVFKLYHSIFSCTMLLFYILVNSVHINQNVLKIRCTSLHGGFS